MVISMNIVRKKDCLVVRLRQIVHLWESGPAEKGDPPWGIFLRDLSPYLRGFLRKKWKAPKV